MASLHSAEQCRMNCSDLVDEILAGVPSFDEGCRVVDCVLMDAQI